jgi:hypothetical protein
VTIRRAVASSRTDLFYDWTVSATSCMKFELATSRSLNQSSRRTNALRLSNDAVQARDWQQSLRRLTVSISMISRL